MQLATEFSLCDCQTPDIKNKLPGETASLFGGASGTYPEAETMNLNTAASAACVNGSTRYGAFTKEK